ncbi:MAG: DegV family protein [Corynebacterium sp.]|nr:DegV family protein [Corynebacterium sp.]
MAVRVVTDSASGLPADIVSELEITVCDLHVMDGETTSGLSALELAAAYGRQMERASDDGLVCIHLAKELSSTWSAGVTASGVFPPGQVRVVDSGSAGMALGAAAMSAARLAADGADVDECFEAAQDTLDRAKTWLYLDSLDDLRKSGRLSTGTALSTALLATKPIMAVVDGKIELVGRTRTQTKAFIKLVDLIASEADGKAVFVALQHHHAADNADKLRDLLEGALPAGSSFMVLPLNEVLAVHTGPGAIGVTAVFSA